MKPIAINGSNSDIRKLQRLGIYDQASHARGMAEKNMDQLGLRDADRAGAEFMTIVHDPITDAAKALTIRRNNKEWSVVGLAENFDITKRVGLYLHQDQIDFAVKYMLWSINLIEQGVRNEQV